MGHTQQSGAACFDREKALEGVEGDLELMGEIAEIFIEDCPRLVRCVRDAVEANDAAMLADTAHALKGSIGVFAAEVATDLAAQLEHKGRAGSLDGSRGLIEALEAEVTGLLRELADFVRA